MELRHLRYFVTVVEEMHFRRAAERLFIVQPALSKQIKALEDELGTPLLIRNRRTVALTEAGSAFYEEAIAVLRRTEVAKERARATGQGLTGQFSIGFIQPTLFGLLQHTLTAYRGRYPDVRLRAVEGSTRECLDRMARGEIDCAFVRLPVERRDGASVELVSQEEVTVALPTEHPLTAQHDVDLADLATEDLILIERHLEPALYDTYIAACTDAGFSPRVGHTVTSTWAALGLIAGGLGVGFAPISAQAAAPQGVTFRRIRRRPPHLNVGLVWMAKSPTPVLHNFLELRPWAREPGDSSHLPRVIGNNGSAPAVAPTTDPWAEPTSTGR